MAKKMTRTQALAYLAQMVEESIVDAEIPLHYFTGEEMGGKPDRVGLLQLAEALEALGFNDAAHVVRGALPLQTHKRGS